MADTGPACAGENICLYYFEDFSNLFAVGANHPGHQQGKVSMAKKLNLKVDSSDVRDFQGRVRFKFTRKFVQEGITGNGAVLSIGTENRFDTLMAEQFNLPISFTSGDFDREWSAPEQKYDYVFCFEVIEHLMNPLHFLDGLHRYISQDTRIFLTTPYRPHLFWNNQHFHEYDQLRFKHLLDSAGFAVVRHQTRIAWYHPLFYLSGVRPFLRLTVGRSRTHLFELKTADQQPSL